METKDKEQQAKQNFAEFLNDRGLFYKKAESFNDINEIVKAGEEYARQYHSNEVDLEGLEKQYYQFAISGGLQNETDMIDIDEVWKYFKPHLKTPEPKESDAVEFGKWINKNATQDSYKNNKDDWMTIDKKGLTTQELYQQFLNSK
jgi:site-specific recombinase XerD